MSDQPIIDLASIACACKAKAAENEAFQRYVKADLELSDYRLNTLVKRTTQEVWAQIDCRTCANCCKTRHPLFSREEIQRIADCVGLTPQELRARYLEYDRDSGRYITRQLPCPFLKDNLCTVYEVRPATCAGYPHLHRNLRSRLSQTIDNAETCPIVFNVLERLKQRLGFRLQASPAAAVSTPAARKR
jgi:Fe-S-cluster containining protein